MRRIITTLIIGALACDARAAESQVPVTVLELIAHPQDYASKRVRVTGVWVSDFELSAFVPVIGDKAEYATSIWIELRLDESSAKRIFDEINEIRHKQGPSMSTIHIVCDFEGVFVHDSNRPQGHLGAYDSTLIVYQVHGISEPNQSSEPTLSSVTPPAGQESRPR